MEDRRRKMEDTRKGCQRGCERGEAGAIEGLEFRVEG
jgi:hypothetical protein